MATDDGFDDFFRATYPRLVAFGVAMSTPRATAEEVAQDAMMRAHQHWDEIGHFDQPFRWVRRVTANLLIDRKRSSDSEQRAIDRLRRGSDPRPDRPLHMVSATERWNELVDDLTDNQRLIAALHYGEDLSVAAIAQELDISVGTVKSTLSKIRNNVRRSIGEEATS